MTTLSPPSLCVQVSKAIAKAEANLYRKRHRSVVLCMQLSPACCLYCTSTANHHLFCPFLHRLEGEEEVIADEPEAKKFKEQVCVLPIYHVLCVILCKPMEPPPRAWSLRT